MQISPYSQPTIIVVPSGYNAPAREHTERPWMKGRCYHRRVQKKWIRRFGLVWIETMKRGDIIVSEITNTIFCRAEDAQNIRAALQHGPLL